MAKLEYGKITKIVKKCKLSGLNSPHKIFNEIINDEHKYKEIHLAYNLRFKSGRNKFKNIINSTSNKIDQKIRSENNDEKNFIFEISVLIIILINLIGHLNINISSFNIISGSITIILLIIGTILGVWASKYIMSQKIEKKIIDRVLKA